jgi:MSHA biogenesis protein MshE
MLSQSALRKVKLGDMLVGGGYITAAQLQQALNVQKEQQSGKLGDVLMTLGFVTEISLMKALSQQLNLPVIDLKHYVIKPEVIQQLSERIARRYRVALLDLVEDHYVVGMADPTDLVAYDELTRVLKKPFNISIVPEADLLRLFDLVYRRTEEISSFAEALKEEIVQEEKKYEEEAVETISAEAAPVVKLLDSIFEDAVQTGASDIHIEPDEKQLRIRQRVDGVLQEHIIPGKEIIAALVLRIKLIANMNISEKRLPQDGRFNIQVKGHNVDVRVAVIPVYYGEAVVMRLLDQAKGVLKLEQLGMEPTMMQKIRTLIHKPNGLVLVTGPTGSGKTTTLYAILSELNDPHKKIITIEDPVEYVLPRINQVQVNPLINLTFANVLRSVVRHDPDIIMVGEMRDEETVRTGLRAAMTGHLVFSTLHTNDSISSTIRLVDMGAEGFLVAGALLGVLAQRLVRKICDACIQPYNVSEHEQVWIDGFLGKPGETFSFKHGVGCSRCNHSGYRGRIGIYEYLEIDLPLGDALRANDTTKFMQLAKAQPGFKSLAQCVFDDAVNGATTLEEVFRISGGFA